MKRYFISFLVILALYIVSAKFPAHATTSPIPLSDIVGTTIFPNSETPRVSHDGDLVAFTSQNLKRVTFPWSDGVYNYTKTGVPVVSQGTDINVAHIRTTVSTNLTGGTASNWAPVWSMDDRRLAFFSDRGGVAQLWIWERRNGQMRRASVQIVHPWSGDVPIWLTNSSLLIPVLPANMTLTDSNIQALDVPGIYRLGSGNPTVRIYAYDPKNPNEQQTRSALQGYYGSDNGVLRDFISVDILSGRVRKAFSTAGFVAGLSSDRTQAVVSERVGAAADAFDQSLFDVRSVSLATGTSRILLSHVPMGYGTTVSWSPHDHLLAFVPSSVSSGAGLSSLRYGKIGECYVINADTGDSRLVTNGKHPNLGYSYDSPIWDENGNFIYFLENGVIWKADLRSATIRPLTKAPTFALSTLLRDENGRIQPSVATTYGFIGDAATQDQGFASLNAGSQTFKFRSAWPERIQDPIIRRSKLIFVSEDESHAQDLWLFDLGSNRRVQLTHLNPRLEQYHYPARRIVSWTVKNGTKAKGVLILPSEYTPGRRYPTIIYQYPFDSKSEEIHYFDDGYFYPQLLASRGYAVFEPDFPLKNWMGLTNGTAIALINAMLDKLVGIGIANPNRFGLTGESAGGYSTIAVITQTDRFAAAIEDSGFASEFTIFTDLYRNGDAFYVQQEIRSLSGTPWTARRAYIDASPFFALDKVHTPLLIIHGDYNGALGRKNADDIFVSLRSLGREVTYALYPDGGHTMATFSYAQKLDAWQRIIAWFDDHLKNG